MRFFTFRKHCKMVRPIEDDLLCVGATNTGKTELCLKLLECRPEDLKFLICQTLYWNNAYLTSKEIHDKKFLIIPPENIESLGVQKTLKGLSEKMAGVECIIIVDDCIAEKEIDSRKLPLSKIAKSWRQLKHSLRIITQRYPAVPRILRDQLSVVAILLLKGRRSFNQIIEENGGVIDASQVEEIRSHLNSRRYAATLIFTSGDRGLELL